MAEEEHQVNDADFDGLDEGMEGMGAEEGAAGEGIDVSSTAVVAGRSCLRSSLSLLCHPLCFHMIIRDICFMYVLLQELEAMKQKLKELEEEAAKLRNTQVCRADLGAICFSRSQI
jgi:hypothetical protein